MKVTKRCLLLIMIILCTGISCSDENDIKQPKTGVFISINDDVRIPSLVSIPYYQIKQSSYNFKSSISEPEGIQFVMDIYDPKRQYIGGIGGMTTCVRVWVSITVYKTDFASPSQIKTFSIANTKNEKADKAKVFIEFRNIDDDRFLYGTAIENQTINIKKENGEYFVYFKNLNFKSPEGSTFNGSIRLITN